MQTLEPLYDSRKSFYGKAHVLPALGENSEYLRSYESIVAFYNGISGTLEVYNLESASTTRHVREFMQQKGFPYLSKKEINDKYMV